jgi:general secretion pathway protein C
MQDLIKRYFWVVGALTVVLCSFFAAKAAGHVIDAKVLGDAKQAPKVTVIAPKPTVVAAAVRSKEGKPLADRNMFCSDCLPPVVVAAAPTDPSQIPLTSLPLVLVATTVNTVEKYSLATVLNNGTQKQGAYAPGDTIPGAGPVKAIYYRYVDFHNTQTNRIERISLLGDVPPVAPAVAAVTEQPAPTGDENKDDLQAAIDSGIKKIDDGNYEIDRSLVDRVLANPMAIAKGARVVPAVKGGKADGFKLYAIRPNSVYSKLGFSNGDTLHSINGFELTSADKALEVYTKLKEANSLQVEITRRGKPVSINYSIK